MTAAAMSNRIHSLDGLRAVAASLVVLHHLGVASFASKLGKGGDPALGNLVGGVTASGVELFFVLSAIVLAGPFVRGERTLNLASYMKRRSERLFPPYFVAWLLAGSAIYLATAFPTWWTDGASLPTFSVPAWLAQAGIIYFGPDLFNFAWWSLTTEVSFYVLLPALIPLFKRLSVRSLCLAFAISIAIALAAPALDTGLPRTLVALIEYAPCFCAGILLGRQVPAQRFALVLSSAGLVWIVCASALPVLNSHVGWGLFYFGLVATAMHRGTAVSRWLSGYLFVWLGERSYSLFLVHYSVIGIVCHAASMMFDSKSLGYFIITRLLSLALSMLAAMTLFYFVERRFAHNLVTGADFIPRLRRARIEWQAKMLRPEES